MNSIMTTGTDLGGSRPEVYWHDGLLLRPHHLQALQSHWRSWIGFLRSSQSFAYGIRRLEIREEAIGNGVLDLVSCELVMPDGTVVIGGKTARITPIEFRNLGLDEPVVPLWIGIPLPNATGANVEDGVGDGVGRPSQGRRYVVEHATVADENTGGNRQEIGLRYLRASCFVGARPPEGYQSLQIGLMKKVIEEGEVGRRYKLSPAFVPACLSMDAAPALHRVLKDILDQVEEKNARLHQHLGRRRSLLTGDSTERPGTLLKLQATNAVLPVLRQIVQQTEIHPFDAFMHVCRLVGELALFSRDWRVPDIKSYVHTDPMTAFLDVKRVVMELLAVAVETGIDRTPFELSTSKLRQYQVTVPERYLTDRVTLYIGVQTKRPEAEVAGWFAQGRTSVAAPTAIPSLRQRRTEGVGCAVDPVLHADLRDRDELVFLKIAREGDLWDPVHASKQLALAGEAANQEDASFYLYAVGLRGEDEEQ